MRKYAAIWERIKATGGCKIMAPEHFHERIKKAVTKESCRDEDFKDDMALEGKKPYIRKEAKGEMLVFTLKSNLGLSDFGVSVADICQLEFMDISFEEYIA
jgi:hypothetical protein